MGHALQLKPCSNPQPTQDLQQSSRTVMDGSVTLNEDVVGGAKNRYSWGFCFAHGKCMGFSLSLSLWHTTHTPNPRTHARRARESKRRRAMILAALVMNTQGKPRITKFYVPLVCTPTPASFRLWTFFFCIFTSLSLCLSLSGHWGESRSLMFSLSLWALGSIQDLDVCKI